MSDAKTTLLEGMKLWDLVHQPPADALKTIVGGRISGKSDINPMWRIQKLTELFGVIGFGWRYEIVRTWTDQGKYLEEAACHEVICSAEIKLHVKIGGEWSEAILGIGGNKLVEKEKDHAYTNDEGFKMAVTDAISVACKALGFGADIYFGRWDGSKYNIPADGDKVATWLIACQKASEDRDVEEFKNWWPTHADQIKEECQIAGAGAVHEGFMQTLRKLDAK